LELGGGGVGKPRFLFYASFTFFFSFFITLGAAAQNDSLWAAKNKTIVKKLDFYKNR
jgi:hypothetical protein